MTYQSKGTLEILRGTITTGTLPSYPTDYVSFSGTALTIAPGGFSYGSESDDLPWMTFNIVSQYSDVSFRGILYKLDTLKQFSHDYSADATRADPVYLRWASEGEPLKTSNVYDLTYEVLSEQNLSAQLGYDAAKLMVSVQHAPYWEDGTLTHYTGTLNSLGGTKWIDASAGAYTGGNISSRIAVATILSAGTASAHRFQNCWFGIKEKRNGYAGFKPVWEAEYSTLYYDASATADVTASNGTAIVVNFSGSADMARRFAINLSDVSVGNYDDMCGNYLVLGRIKLSAGTVEVATDMRYGFLFGVSGMEQSAGISYISAVQNANLVNYNFVPLGAVNFPPTGDRNAIISSNDTYTASMGISLFAERLSAGGSFTIDCLVFIPTDHMAIIDNANLGVSSGLLLFTDAEDKSFAVQSGSYGLFNIGYSFENWNYPIDGGLLVFAGQYGTIHSINGTAIVDIDLIKRYRSYRVA